MMPLHRAIALFDCHNFMLWTTCSDVATGTGNIAIEAKKAGANGCELT